MQTTQPNIPPAEEPEDHGDHHKALTVAELDRLTRECAETDDWFHGKKLALRVFRAAPNPRDAEPARCAFKVLVNAMQGRDDQGDIIPGGVSADHIRTLRNETLKLLGIAQGELFAPAHEDVFLKIDANGIAPAPELKEAVKAEAQKLRDEAAKLRKAADKVIEDAMYSDQCGAVQSAREDAAVDRRRAEKLEQQAAELEGGAK